MTGKICTLIVMLFLAKTIYSQPTLISEQNSGTTQTLTSINSNAFGTINTYSWVCGYGGTVLRSTNGGTNWQNVGSNGIPSTIQLVNILSVDINTAITAGYIGSNTFVFRTSNAGANWVEVFTQANGFINAIVLNSSTRVFMMGDPVGGRWSLWKSTNAGLNWDSSGLYLPQVGTEAGWNNSLIHRNNQIWFGTNNSKIYYSSNAGTVWNSQATTGELNSYAVWFRGLSSSPEGFAGGSTLLKTSNSGINWNTQASMGTGNFGGVTGGPYIITDNPLDYFYIYYVRGNNIIYGSSDRGATWGPQHTAPAGTYRHIGANYLASEFWAVRDNGGITYMFMNPTGINQIGNEVPDKFTLDQNFPNPFNPTTTIKFSIQTAQYVTLKVYDILGNEIETLVNEKQNPGSYSVEFDASNNPSGIYYYKLEAGDFREVRKMILVK